MPQEREFHDIPRALTVSQKEEGIAKGSAAKCARFHTQGSKYSLYYPKERFFNRNLAPFCHLAAGRANSTSPPGIAESHCPNRISRGVLEKGARRSLINNDSGQNQRNVAKQFCWSDCTGRGSFLPGWPPISPRSPIVPRDFRFPRPLQNHRRRYRRRFTPISMKIGGKK